MQNENPISSENEIDSAHSFEGKPLVIYNTRRMSFWEKMGGGSLTIAILFHLLLLVIGGIWVISIISPPKEDVPFLPSGGRAGDGEHKVQQKKITKVTPTNAKRVFAEGATSSYSIPDPGEGFGEMSALTSLGGGGMSGSSGLGTTGLGKGMNTVLGPAALGTAKLFGIEIKETKNIAVVVDVSRSMTKYLPTVAQELDKVATKGPLILYFGCGLFNPFQGKSAGDKIYSTKSIEFDTFWQHMQGNEPLFEQMATFEKTAQYKPELPMPRPELHKQMRDRPNTYFVYSVDVVFAQDALTAKQLKDSDTLYWFADFEDGVHDPIIKEVLRTLKSRKQKLYIHGSIQGRFFDKVKEQLVVPNRGVAIVKDIQ